MTPEERERYQAFLTRADEEIRTVRDNMAKDFLEKSVGERFD